MEYQSQASLQYVVATVTSTVNGEPYNPTSDVVAMAFTVPDAGAEGATWLTAAWASTQATPAGGYLVQCLVGPGGGTTQLTPGRYQVYVKVTASPEIPVFPALLLTVTN